MSNYKKKWSIAFGLLIIIFFVSIIYGALTSEKRGDILQAIDSLENGEVISITISPSNPQWKINLTLDTLNVTDKNIIYDITSALKGLKEKHITKGAKRYWECNLLINLTQSNNIKLKDKEKLAFKTYDTEEGFYMEMKNVMGHKTYNCQQLKLLLEKLANFHTPLGGD